MLILFCSTVMSIELSASAIKRLSAWRSCRRLVSCPKKRAKNMNEHTGVDDASFMEKI